MVKNARGKPLVFFVIPIDIIKSYIILVPITVRYLR